MQIEQFLQEINEDIKTKLGSNDFATTKQATLDCEVKNVKSIVCETEERCDRLQNLVQDLDKALHQTMQSIADIENQLAMQQRIASVQNIRGKQLQAFLHIRSKGWKMGEKISLDLIASAVGKVTFWSFPLVF